MEAAMMAMGGVGKEAFPTKHVFTPGLYSRMIYMPEGTWLTSEIHNTEHQFAILTGIVSVWTYETGWCTLTAPHVGVTTPGTRRVLFIHEDACWVTYHPNPEELKTPEEVGDKILLKRTNPYLMTIEKKEASE